MSEQNHKAKKADPTAKIGKRSSKAIAAMIISIVLVLAIGSGAIYYFYYKNDAGETTQADGRVQIREGMDMSEMVTASGTTSIGVVMEEIDLSFLETDLTIEEVYVSNNTEIAAGDAVLKVSESDIETAKQELENALEEASLAYRAGVITYDQAVIEAEYEYDASILAAQQAEAVYQATLEELQDAVDEAQEALDEANEDIAEYTDAIENNGYDEEYEVTALYTKYEYDYDLLFDYIEENELSWEDVTSGKGSSTSALGIAAALYKELTEEYEAWEAASEEMEDAVEEATYSLKKLQVQLTTLENAVTTAQNNYETKSIEAKQTYDEAVAEASIAQDTYDTSLKKAQEELDTLQDDLDDAQDHLDTFNELISDGYLYADTDGTVLMVMVREDENLNDATSVLVYSDSSIMTVAASVDQSYINELTVGESANVMITDYGNYTGTITSINPVSSSSSRSSVTYTVTITLEGDVSELKENLTATVIFGMGGESGGTEASRD